MDSNDSMLVLFGGIAASSIVLDVNGTVAALGNAWCIIGSSHSGFPDDNFSVTALPLQPIKSNNQIQLIQKGMRRMLQKQF